MVLVQQLLGQMLGHLLLLLLLLLLAAVRLQQAGDALVLENLPTLPDA